MEEGALFGNGGNAPLAPRRVPFPFAAEEEEGGSRSSRSPCSRAARSGLEIMPILCFAVLCLVCVSFERDVKALLPAGQVKQTARAQ